MINEALLSAGVTKAFEVSFTELLSAIKSKTSHFKKLKIDIPNAYRNAILVENVKTIWQIDKAVNLNEFYFPSKIIVGGEKIKIDRLSSIPSISKCVIEGTAGQGKSIFLRYLTGYELKYGSNIPLFIELRKVSDKKTIEDLICDSLIDLGINVEIHQLHYLFSSGKITLLLDAFDEIPLNNIKETITFIESLASKYHDLQVVISSRPSSEIQKSTLFTVYKLAEINPSDFRPILNKFFFNDEGKVDEIITSIHKSTTDIANLIKTPLLLTLLCITYKGYNKIPESLSDFYNGLFHLLVSRHDSTKPGFIREYSSKLNENQLEKLFHAFCFQCMVNNSSILSRLESVEFTDKASKLTNISPCSETNFIRDCVKNTCLLLDENNQFHFIHKSIMEYHSARYIKDADVDLKKRFYKSVFVKYSKYKDVLKYLKDIDETFYQKEFEIPYRIKWNEYFKWDGNSYNYEKMGNDITLDIECFNGQLRICTVKVSGVLGDEITNDWEIPNLVFDYQDQIDNENFKASRDIKIIEIKNLYELICSKVELLNIENNSILERLIEDHKKLDESILEITF
ncbi:NACHT domain-containing NTPase [Photobacterium sp. GB-72]|uniref:NACHT domain-containing protein n=1 Tax=Photobacterium sp. GB-72 TaxID=2022105 RepID=UPI001304CE3A|nr:NACHT domain-containing protein [Photobacterium sp. GB-72]